MRRGVHEGETSGERAAGDLIVVVWVTPAADTAGGVWVPESAVLKVRCVCHDED